MRSRLFLACGRQVHRNAAHGKGQSAALRRCPHPVPRFLHRRVRQSHDIKAGKSLRNVAFRRDGAALYPGDTQRSDAADHVSVPLFSLVFHHTPFFGKRQSLFGFPGRGLYSFAISFPWKSVNFLYECRLMALQIA